MKMIGDPNAELAGYRNNELEISRVPPGTESATLSDATLGQEVVRILDLSSVALFLNNATPPFNNQKVRQAFSAAIDRDAWIDQVINGVGRAATSWLPPELPGHDPNLGSEYGFNPDLARRLLAEAGYPDGAGFPSVTFSFPNVGGEQIIAEFVQAQIKSNLGVDMNRLCTLNPVFSPLFVQILDLHKKWARPPTRESLGSTRRYYDIEPYRALR